MKLSAVFKAVLLCAELFLLLVFIFPITKRVLNAGNLCGMAACFVFIAATVFSDKLFAFIASAWQRTGGRIALLSTGAVLLAGIIYLCVLSVLMANAYNDPPESPNVVVVLGCQVRGTTPSQMLRYRLDAAYDYLTEHEGALCVVTGGQGSGEDIPEAHAMKEYLVGKGISPERIITEDRSTNTEENLKFTADILSELGLPLEITIVSDGYHQYRARLLAKELGYSQINSISGYTRAYMLPTYWVREWLALTAYFIFG